jgi:hypothetical protein
MKFALSRLTDYSSEAILSELQRVAALVEMTYMSKASFNEHSKVHSATVIRRFKRLGERAHASWAEPPHSTSEHNRKNA